MWGVTPVPQRHSTGTPSKDQECRPRFTTEADGTQRGEVPAKITGLQQGQAPGTPGWECRQNFVWGSGACGPDTVQHRERRELRVCL